MLIKALLFSLLVFGITMAISLIVAVIIKIIGGAVQKREAKAPEKTPN